MAKKVTHHRTVHRKTTIEDAREDENENEEEQEEAMPEQQSGTPTPAVNPTAPVGAVRTGSTGVDQAGNVWYLGLSGATFIATMTLPLPAEAGAPDAD